jgi:hypothetical protein
LLLSFSVASVFVIPTEARTSRRRGTSLRCGLLATNKPTRTGAPSCAAQQGGRFCRSSIRQLAQR